VKISDGGASNYLPSVDVEALDRMERFKHCELKPLAATLKFVPSMGRKGLKTET
jgi:hypothetical protein